MIMTLGAQVEQDTAREFIPVITGGEGTGFIIWGDAPVKDLIMSPYPSPTDAMENDTSQIFSAKIAFEIDPRGAVQKIPSVLVPSKAEEWDSTILRILHGWVFKSSQDSIREDTVEIYYVARKPWVAKDTSSTLKIQPAQFNSNVFSSTAEILGDKTDIPTPQDSSAPLGLNFTFLGDLNFNDLQSHVVPNLEESMREKGVTSAVARFDILVSSDGWVDDAVVVQSTGRTAWDYALDKALRQWRFKPSYKNERKAEVVFVISFE